MPDTSISIANYSPPPDILHDKLILVTGAGDGFGRSLSISFAKHGATVILLGKTVKKLENVYDEIEKQAGPQPVIMPMDLEKATESDYQQLANAIYENFGRLDGMVLNAVTLGQHSPVTSIDFDQWSRSLQVNLTANFLLLKHCSAVLNQANRASVVYISDQVALHGKAYWASYSASKAACLNLIQTVADEWESNTEIRLNSIDPGPMSTGMRRQAFPGENPKLRPEPDTVTKSVLYFMDSGHAWPNGQHFSWNPGNQKLVLNRPPV
jgi:NAD(P)-dependent dehydrogenase (short-subunit alcohol dehydrogenase family)